ncbi:MAG: gliding motility-associated protein GldE [Bacteroidota bacterium]
MDPGPALFNTASAFELLSVIKPGFGLTTGFLVQGLVLLGLLFFSGFISGSETAFFAITPAQLLSLKDSKHTPHRVVYNLLTAPKRLIATHLIAINFVNIAIVVVSSVMIEDSLDFADNDVLRFLVQVVAVTFVILLFCEVMPKVYATHNAVKFATTSAYAVFLIDKLFRPFTWLLVTSTSLVDKRIASNTYEVSVDQLTHAIDITSDNTTPEEEKKILKGIARFGNIDVKQIMKPRMDVIAFEKEASFSEILPAILENRYSRIPVYEETFDQVSGILYIKDLLPHLDSADGTSSYDWTELLRPAYFVPESKKINDLLQEFQEKKMHLAIVIDEYGGTSGIVTLEDILEEIVGEINDEFDDEELFYSRLDDRTVVFEGKTLINDVCRVMEAERKLFDIGKEEVDTLAGLLLELKGSIPSLNEVIIYKDISFTVESADKRRIKRVKVTLPENKS